MARCQATEGCEAICVTTTPRWEDPDLMCGLRKDVWEEHCAGDNHHDTYYMETALEPPSPPRDTTLRTSPDTINERFRTEPYGEWADDGRLSPTGVLVHCIDGYEEHAEPWKPAHTQMSASIIFADQRVGSHAIPIFDACHAQGGVIFRPGTFTRIVCGNGADSGGGCHDFCEGATEMGDVALFQHPGDGCGKSWRPKDFGVYLRRVAAWQKLNGRSVYNEIIVEGGGRKSAWAANLPDIIEAWFYVKGGDGGAVRQHWQNYLSRYGLDGVAHPLLKLAPNDWQRPFSYG